MKKIYEVRRYLTEQESNHRARERRWETEATLIVVSVLSLTCEEAIDFYNDASWHVTKWSARKFGIYRHDGSACSCARDVAQMLGLTVPSWEPAALARLTSEGICRQCTEDVLRPEALRETWTFIDEEGLKLPACARNC